MANNDTNTAADLDLKSALETHGTRLSQCVIVGDEVDAVLDAAYQSADSIARMSNLISVARKQLEVLRDVIQGLDENACDLAHRVSGPGAES